MDEHVKEQLDRIERSLGRMERAIFGELDAGLSGLVQDMREMKDFKAKQNLKAAGVAGAVSVAALVVLITATAGQHHTPPPRLVGDELGRDNDETLTDYVQRAQHGFSAAAPGDEVYALVTFRQPLTAQAAGAGGLVGLVAEQFNLHAQARQWGF